MAMEGNRDEAERCVRLAEEAAAAGSLARAERLLAKALRLFPSAAAAQQLRALQDRRPAPAPAPAPASPRRPSAAAAPTADSAATEASAESVELVKRINRGTDYYEILEVSKSSSEEEIKKAYRKLSLKVHPDKNKAPGAEEAFKAVSRAFQCLSDGDARSHYDRCGQEGRRAAQPQWGQPHASRYRGGSPFFGDDAFDPNEVFNAFFGMHDMRHANGRVYRAHFGQRRGGGDRSQGGASMGPSVLGLLQLLPLLFIFLYAMLPPSEPAYKLHQVEPYMLERRTSGFGVPFYVRSDFDVQHPEHSRQRRRLDQIVDREYRDGVETRCYYERVQQQHQQQLQRWRQGPKARDMAMPNCMELRRLQQTAY